MKKTEHNFSWKNVHEYFFFFLFNGSCNRGGDCSRVKHELVNVQTVYSSLNAFCALTKNGTIVTWGSSQSGGNCDHVKHELVDIQTVYSNASAFCVLTTNGSIVTWGLSGSGGNCSKVAQQVCSNVIHVVSNFRAFGAVKKCGKVLTNLQFL